MHTKGISGLPGILAAAWFMLLSGGQAFAYDYLPTETEWARWPEWCRANFSAWRRAIRSEAERFADRVPPKLAAKWEHIGPFYHHCAGKSYMDRARMESDPDRRKYWLTRAVDEMNFTYVRTAPSNIMYGESVAGLAVAHLELGHVDDAFDLLQNGLLQKPSDPKLYAAMFMVHRRAGRHDKALEVLLKGNKESDGTSAELNYFLGLEYFRRKNYDDAAVHAKRAYELGYPLPGLRTKLKQVGKWD